MKVWKTILLICVEVFVIGLIIPYNFQNPVEGGKNKDYHPQSYWYYPWGTSITHKGVDIFTIGSATYFNDNDYKKGLLKTAEIAGHTVNLGNKRHYLLGNIALVGEAITLAMRTHYRGNYD